MEGWFLCPRVVRSILPYIVGERLPNLYGRDLINLDSWSNEWSSIDVLIHNVKMNLFLPLKDDELFIYQNETIVVEK